MTDQQPDSPRSPVEAAFDRLAVAQDTFDDVNKVLPPGLAPFQLPPFLESTAACDALVRTLIAQGLLDEQEFVTAKLTRQAELVEDCAAQAKTAKGRITQAILTQGISAGICL